MPHPGLIFVAILLAASFAARSTAAAPDGGAGSAFDPSDIYIGVQHEPHKNLSDPEIFRFFNRARCDCSEPVYLYFALNESGAAKLGALPQTSQMSIWVGTGCDQPDQRQGCLLMSSQLVATLLSTGNLTLETNARTLSAEPVVGGAFPGGGNPTCTSTSEQFTQTIYVVIDTEGDGYPEVSYTRSVLIDLTAPPAPNGDQISVAGGNEALEVRWPKIDTSVYDDLAGYQILCNRGGYLQVFDEGTFTPAFQSCPAAIAAGAGGVDGLDPLFVCSSLLSPSTTSHRIRILQNDIVYGAAVVAVDKSGNASVPDIVYGTPGATENFYDIYREPTPGPAGGTTGGFCAIAPAESPRRTLGQTALGVAVAGALLTARRRRRR